MRLYTSRNSAAARLYVCTDRFDVAAACPPNVCNASQNGSARRAKVGYMRVNAGPDAALTRLHASTRRPDILGTNPYSLSLLRHCACCREQRDRTDCKNVLYHRLSSRFCLGVRDRLCITKLLRSSGLFAHWPSTRRFCWRAILTSLVAARAPLLTPLHPGRLGLSV
jgi:hypothetical protein